MNKLRNNGRLTNGQVGFLLVVPGLAVFTAIILYPLSKRESSSRGGILATPLRGIFSHTAEHPGLP